MHIIIMLGVLAGLEVLSVYKAMYMSSLKVNMYMYKTINNEFVVHVLCTRYMYVQVTKYNRQARVPHRGV